jgi:hypothetical protein
MLAKIQVAALDQSGVDLPAAFGQNRRDRLCRAEDDAVLDPDDTRASRRFDDLSRAQLRLWHPARLGLGAFGLAAFGLNLLAVMRDERGEILPQPIRQEQRGAVRCQDLGDLMNETLRPGQGAVPHVNSQDQLTHGVHRHPDPLRRARQALGRPGLGALTLFDGAEQGEEFVHVYLLDEEIVAQPGRPGTALATEHLEPAISTSRSMTAV